MQEWKRANSRPRVASLPILNKDKMLNGGHLDINSIQFCSDSLKERLKQTMLNQELVFMGQVLELHRLYRAQTAMAEDSKRRGLDRYTSHLRGLNSSPVNWNNQVKSFMSDIQCTTPGFKQKPLDLQLSADEFICQSANAVPIDLNLSLSSGEETSKKGERRSRMGKGACVPPSEIIDLEDPNLIVSNYDVNPGGSSGFSASISSIKEKNVFERSVIGVKHNSQSFSNSGVRRVSNGATSSRPFINVDPTVQRRALYKSGLNGDVLASDTSIPRNKPMMLDLNNTIQLDDLSDLSNANSGVFNSLAGTVFSSSGRELNGNKSAQTPDILVQNNLKSGRRISTERNKPEDNRGKIIIIDLDSDSDSDSGEGLCSSGSDPKIESVGSSSKLANELVCGFEIGEAAKPELGLEKDPKPLCQNMVTESLDLNTMCSESNIESVGSSSKLSNGLLCGFEIGAVGPKLGVEKDKKTRLSSKGKSEAVEPELGLEKDPKPFSQNVLVTESLDSNTLCSKSKIESGGSLSKLSNGPLNGFEKGEAAGSELDVQKDTKSFCQNVLVTESLDSNTLSSKSKIESRGSSSKLLNGLLFGFDMGGAVGRESGVEKDPKPCLDSNTLFSKSKTESGGGSSSKLSKLLLCEFETGETPAVPRLGLEKDPKPFCQKVTVTESIDSNTLCSKSKELELDETDQKAAELLVQLSRERPVCDVGYVVQKKEHDRPRPQRPLDSYEEMVLNAKECGPEDYCVSSNAFVVDVSETDSRYKLKRGTRMKDFQKDILSSLSTLSRHEIREDINIFDGVIRSREYKRMRANANFADDSDWCMPRKSRRSRFSRR